MTTESWEVNWIEDVLDYYGWNDEPSMPNSRDISILSARFQEMSDGQKMRVFHVLLKHALGGEHLVREVAYLIPEDLVASICEFNDRYGQAG